MMKKFLFLETAVLSVTVAVLLSFAARSHNNSDTLALNDTETSIQVATPSSLPSHSMHKLGDFYPEP